MYTTLIRAAGARSSIWQDPDWRHPRLPLRPGAARLGRPGVRAGAHSAARSPARTSIATCPRRSRAHSGRHPLPTPAKLAAHARPLGHRRATCRWSRTTRATARTPRGCGGCCAGSATSSVAVLDGGFAAWQEAGLPRRARAAHDPRAAQLRRRARARAAVSRPPRSQQALAQRGAIAAGRCARRRTASPARTRRIDPVAGHVPGARNHPFASNLGGRRPLPAPPTSCAGSWQRTLLGARRRERVVAMCGSGVTACHNLLALEVAGSARRSLYAGSWSEWIRDPSHARSPRRVGHADFERIFVSSAPIELHSWLDYRSSHLLYGRCTLVAADPKTAVNGKPKYNPAQPWRIEDSLDLYHVQRLGQGLLLHQRQRPRRGAAGHAADGARNRPVRSRRGPEGARPDHAGRRALLGHPRAPAAAPARRLRAGHHRERLQEPLRRGVSRSR